MAKNKPKGEPATPLEKLRNKNEQWAVFAEQLLIHDFDNQKAAIAAKFAPSGAKAYGCRLRKRPEVIEAVDWLIIERTKRTQIDADYVLKRLVEIDQMDVIDILNDDMSMKPVSEWPAIWRQFINGFDVAEMFEGAGDQREMTGILKKIKWPDKVKNLELLGKHVSVQAFNEKKELTGPNGQALMPSVIKVVYE
jgi:phage terminase small subunit